MTETPLPSPGTSTGPWWARLLNWIIPAIGRALKRRSGERPDQ